MEKTLAQELKERLSKDIVCFSYTKKDGTLRQARGTRSSGIIEMLNGLTPNGTGSEKTGTIPYWDLDHEAWRCCLEDSIVSIED